MPSIDVAQGTLPTRRAAGDFDTFIGWSVETWGGHQDLSYFIDSWHSQFVAEPGKPQPLRNWQRWFNPALDKIIEQIRTIGFDDPKGDRARARTTSSSWRGRCRSSRSWPTMSSPPWTRLTGPASRLRKIPYANPVTNWGNSRYMFVKLKPAN